MHVKTKKAELFILVQTKSTELLLMFILHLDLNRNSSKCNRLKGETLSLKSN